jgi:pimeloyl-ACP methyl ester carboxylesterase
VHSSVGNQEVRARGFEFAVSVQGSERGQPALLLHGFPQHSRQWEAVVPRLTGL